LGATSSSNDENSWKKAFCPQERFDLPQYQYDLAIERYFSMPEMGIDSSYTGCQKFFPPPLTLTLSPRWGERG
jgi:hypothetical protein